MSSTALAGSLTAALLFSSVADEFPEEVLESPCALKQCESESEASPIAPTQSCGQCCEARTPVVGYVQQIAGLLGHDAGTRLPRAVAPVSLPLLLLGLPPVVWSQWVSDAEVRVDQFGYRTGAEKVAVLRAPQTGWDGGSTYVPGPVVEVLRLHDHSVAFTGQPIVWNDGQEHAESGDRVWSVDFSALDESGSFYVSDPSTGVRSEPFDIGSNPWGNLLRDSLRTFYYQRCGAPKAAPYADPRWADSVACHLGHLQDTDCRFILNHDPSTSLDLSGGWHDAGDYNKYMNYADGVVHNLLGAFEFYPSAFDDAAGLPESGNGEPDVLDEVAWELEWFLKMQIDDGSVLHKVAAIDYSDQTDSSPPSIHGVQRFYAPSTAPATISACGAYARAALVYDSRARAEFRDLAGRLRVAAERSWDWLEDNEHRIGEQYDNAGFNTVANNDLPEWQRANRVSAAVYLFALTGELEYRDFVDAHLGDAKIFQSGMSPNDWESHEAVLRYSELPGASAWEADLIRQSFSDAMRYHWYQDIVLNERDPYRAFMYSLFWGSNKYKSLTGMTYLAMPQHNLDTPNVEGYLNAGENYLHYLNGVNPTGYTFFTNLGDHGANQSAQNLWHNWFGYKSSYDVDNGGDGPPPGFLQGGPNPQYNGPRTPPAGQPSLKSYFDWNGTVAGQHEKSWQVCENHIPYQAAGVRLLASASGMSQGWFSKGYGLPGAAHAPLLTGDGIVKAGGGVSFHLTDGRPSTPGFLILGTYSINAPFRGGTFVPAPDFIWPFRTDANGEIHTSTAALPDSLVTGTAFWLQFWSLDDTGPRGMTASNALLMVSL